MFFLIATLVFVLLVLNIAYTFPRITRAYQIAHNSKVHTGRYWLGEPKAKTFRLLVLGDSGITGQGISSFCDSAAGRFGCMLAQKYYVEYLNQAGMGKWIGDIDHEQIAGEWDLAVLALGSNDLLHDGNFESFKRGLHDLLSKLAIHSNRVIVAGPGDIASSKIFPWWYRLMLRQREGKYADVIEKATSKIDGHYFNPLTKPEIFKKLNKDGLHLAIEGNHLFAEALWSKWLEWEGASHLAYSDLQIRQTKIKS